mgnify:CR=1 FL=1|tara:strand:+ start:5074 stop:5991 length:918 start_codon:yes stop_codon:yes gene_type:complete
MKSSDLDLNLLPYFNELMRERKVAKVSESMGVSQPAVSNALKRLRLAFGDELFLRTTHGMEPTTLALQLAEPIAYALDTIKAAASQQVTFDPSSAERNFRLGLSDLGEAFFLPPLLERLSVQAPGVSITTVRNNLSTLKDDMENGRVEVSIGLSPQLQGSFFRQRLYRERYVCAFRKGHPLNEKKISVEDFLSFDHVVVSAGNDHSEIDRLLERKGIKRTISVSVPHFGSVGHLLQTTNLIATLPSRMHDIIAPPFNLACADHPVDLSEVSVGIFWHGSLHRDPANQWFRRVIFELFSEVQSPNT